MDAASKWIWCGCVALMGIAGFFVAARGGQSVPFWGGLAFFLFAVLFVFYQIKRSFDRAERGHNH